MTSTDMLPHVEKHTYNIDEDLPFISNLPLRQIENINEDISLWTYDGEGFFPYHLATRGNCMWIIPSESPLRAEMQFEDENRVSFLFSNQNEMMHVLRTLANV